MPPERPTTTRHAGRRPLALALAALLGCGAPPDASRPAGDAPGVAVESTAQGATAPHGAPPPGDAPILLTDDAGRAVVLERPARRVVSLIPALTDVFLALGEEARLVARTDYDVHPSLAHLPSAGGGLTPSLEWLVTLRPDVVLAWPDQASRAVVHRLEALGVPVYTARIERIADAHRAIAAVGTIIGEPEAAAALGARLRAELEAVRQATAGAPRPRVLFLIGWDPPLTASAGTFIHEITEVAGGENIFADVEAGWPQVSLEAIVRRDPEVVIVADEDARGELAARLAALPGWRELSAVRAGRVHELDPDVFSRPGPALGHAARELARLFHPTLRNPDGE